MTSNFYNEWDANTQVANTLDTRSFMQGANYVPPLEFLKMHSITRGSLGAQTTPPAGAYATELGVSQGGTAMAQPRDMTAAVMTASALGLFYLFLV
jgi:hypothetical protein